MPGKQPFQKNYLLCDCFDFSLNILWGAFIELASWLTSNSQIGETYGNPEEESYEVRLL